jgi:NhaA family Na+:H+ antiporter
VIPVFALFSAGISLELESLRETLSHPVTLGFGLGLIADKFVGITSACWLALKLGIGQLPAGTRFSQIAGASLLGDIGFTMAIFTAELGLVRQPEYLLMAKTGILAASLLADIAGFVWLFVVSQRR